MKKPTGLASRPLAAFSSTCLLGLALLVVASSARAEPPAPPAKTDAAEVTLTGTLGCAKCSFHEGKACQNVLKVKDGAKEISYVLADNAVSQSNHEKVCGPTSPATVRGTVTTKHGKKILTASSISFR